MGRRLARGVVVVGLLAASAGCASGSLPKDAAGSDGTVAGDAASLGDAPRGVDVPSAVDGPRNDAGRDSGTETALPSDDAAGTPDGGVKCAIASTGNWSGYATFFSGGAGGGPRTSVDVLWTHDSTEGCVDRYVPAGTATFKPTPGACGQISEPATAPIDPMTDGELVIDRSSSPAGFRMEGHSTWAALIGCAGDVLQPDTAGGDWAHAHGTFDGSVISGEIPNFGIAGDPEETIWELTRVSAEFAPPTGTCSEPPTDHWIGTAAVLDTPFPVSASLTWTRVATTGCVDRFEPAGTATFESSRCTNTPATHAVAASDGALTIDRSVDPPTFVMSGTTVWSATQTCPDGSGGTTTTTSDVGGPWALYNGVFDGDTFSASSMFQFNPLFEWSLQRLR